MHRHILACDSTLLRRKKLAIVSSAQPSITAHDACSKHTSTQYFRGCILFFKLGAGFLGAG